MDKDDLKLKWQDANYNTSENNLTNEGLEKTMALKHSRVISKSLLDVKIKVVLYALILLIYAGLMVYAFSYLRLNFSVNSLVPLALAGIFLLISATSEIVRLLVLTKTADNLSLKDSLLVFCKKLKRIKTTDFIIYLVIFNLFAILIIYNYLTDIGGVKNLSWDNEIVPLPLLGILILMLLSVPWFIKYLNSRRYKKLFSDLMDTIHQLNDQ
jgi:MFS superfamily sulfate permease-like transporter